MKKIIMIAAAAFLVTGIAFADGGKKKAKPTCKHDGKTCSKQDMKTDDKTTTTPPPATPKPANK